MFSCSWFQLEVIVFDMADSKDIENLGFSAEEMELNDVRA